MDKSEFVELKKKHNTHRETQDNAVRVKYEIYVKSKQNSDLDVLLDEVDNYCVGWIKKHLFLSNYYSEENVSAILQDGKIAVWESLNKHDNTGTSIDDIVGFVFGIYKNKFYDYINSTIRNMSGLNGNSISLDDPNGEFGKAMEIGCPGGFEEELLNEQRKLFGTAFLNYCKTFLQMDAFPPEVLALCYARVLPHLLEEIPDTKGSSANWAVNKMGISTISILKDESENYLEEMVDKSLAWGDHFIGSINELVSEKDPDKVLKDVIYTEEYDRSRIIEWADIAHRRCVRQTRKNTKSDTHMNELAREYISKREVIFKLFERGDDR